MGKVINSTFPLVCLLCSCSGGESTEPTRIARISEFENICAQAPGIFVRSTDAGPDFDVGLLATSSGEKIDYYVGAEGVQLRDLKLVSTKLRGISPAGISWHDEKYSQSASAVALTGYRNKFWNASLTVRYWFSANNRRQRELVNALATTTQECADVPSHTLDN